jgi:NTP pyrophosphatase (non-canonical NTP hydrolase)
MNSYTKLTPAQIERLALLAEEAGEVVQAVGKILRRGYRRGHPRIKGRTNRLHLEEELGNLGNAMKMMVAAGDLSIERIALFELQKSGRVGKYLYQQR